ncbi:ATP-dependent RecD-like DNA helicase [Patescibacteria group bacterium]
MKISKDKKEALKEMYSWAKKQPLPHLTVGGYAGVGKTTLISLFRKILHKKNSKLKVAFCSFTGRAARVLSQNLKSESALQDKDFVGTIHSLIYSPVLNDKQQIVGWKLKEDLKFDLIVIDEASMVNKKIWQDLSSFDLPILAVGDHGQLPPIEGKFNLMENPKIKLEKIHRQAENNPIIKVSMYARETGVIPTKRFGDGVEKIGKDDFDSQEKVEGLLRHYSSDMIVLCGYNNTRIKLNSAVRNFLGFESPLPQKGDRVICLKNNHQKGIYNGMLGYVNSIDLGRKDWLNAEIRMDDDESLYFGEVYADQFGHEKSYNFTKNRSKALGDLFDFGYALTVHKAQGSQARKVVVFEERFRQMDDEMWRRWLYTAVTRAEEELFVIDAK